MNWPPRLVETGIDDHGRPAFLSDAPAAAVVTIGPASVAPILWFDTAIRRMADGRVTEPPSSALPPGGLSVQVMRLDPIGDGWPAAGGWRQVPTQDITTVVDGALLVGLQDGDHRLEAGETVVFRGDVHRMRANRATVTTLGAHLSPGPGALRGSHVTPRAGEVGERFGRRLVTGTVDHRSTNLLDGAGPWVLRPASGRVTMADVWQTGGPLSSADDGGDAPGPWQRDPLAGGVLAGLIRLGPGDYSDPANWHTTATIDVDVVISGMVELWLRDLAPAVLGPGDIVIQRGVEHRWQPVGHEPLVMATLMVGAAPIAR